MLSQACRSTILLYNWGVLASCTLRQVRELDGARSEYRAAQAFGYSFHTAD